MLRFLLPAAALLAALLAAFTMYARHALEIQGEGDIVSVSGTRDCPLQAQRCTLLVKKGFRETYRAIPRPGWRFARWERCGDAYPDCFFDAEIAERAGQAGSIDAPLVAVFEPVLAARPNILTIMVDDLGFNDLAINNGNAAIHTPSMDQLAREGVLFTRHYAAQSCSPARASFLTGLVPERLGYVPNGPGISPQVTTLPERLRAEGYTTWHIGKWHIGDLYPAARPDQQGFDRWFGFLNQWRLAGRLFDGHLGLAPPRYEDPWLEGDQDPGRNYPGHLENILTDRTTEVLSSLVEAGRPWYLNLWLYAPHSPISPAPEFAALYPDTDDGRYRALVRQLDHNVGRVISHLASLGVLEDTIVVLVSDNGGARDTLDDDESNAPFAGFKGWLFEGSLRTPMIVRWPSRFPPGTVHDAVVSIEDIYPSVLDAIGAAPARQIDGHSFLPAIEGREPDVGRPLFWQYTGDTNSYSALSADHRWKSYLTPPIYDGVAGRLLYDLEADPTGTDPVEPLPEATFAALHEQYVDWYRKVIEVPTDYTPTTNGAGLLTGTDMLRTPGLGYFTFGVGIADDFRGVIAEQEGSWRMSLRERTVEAQFGELALAGDISSVSDCHSVVVTGNFERRISHGTFLRTTLSLFIDGREVDAIDVPHGAMPADLGAPTRVGDETTKSNGAIFRPRILNRSLVADTVWPVTEFSRELCPRA